MGILETFREIAADPVAYCRACHARQGRPIVGFFCSYAPEELILAAGAHPMRLFGSRAALRFADAHFQPYCCSLVRGGLEEALAGRLAFLAGVVFPHTCDSLQRLSDVWRLNVPYGFHLDVILPVKLDTDSAREYLRDVLGKFRADLAARLGKPITEEALREAIGVMNRVREGLERLYDLRHRRPGAVRGEEIQALVKGSLVMDRREAADALALALDELEARPDSPGLAGKPVLLSGGLCDQPNLYALIEASGGVVVWDDLCTGSRAFAGRVRPEGDALAAIAERLQERVVCPAKHRGLSERADHLVSLAREKGARGVIFVLLKFCDPHAFDYPDLKARLDREGIPSLLFEMEDQLSAEGQLRTRFETFLDIL